MFGHTRVNTKGIREGVITSLKAAGRTPAIRR